MSFAKTVTNDSKTLAGVRFTVHRMGFGRRTDLDLKTLKLRQRLRELEIENPAPTPLEKDLDQQIATARRKAMAVPETEVDQVIQADLLPLLDELRKAQEAIDPDVKKKRVTLNEEYELVERQIRAVWIREGLISIEGGEVGGMTAAELLDYGPPELALEIFQALASDGRLSGAETKNSSSPTTSGALVGGETSSSIAPSAEPPVVAST